MTKSDSDFPAERCGSTCDKRMDDSMEEGKWTILAVFLLAGLGVIGFRYIGGAAPQTTPAGNMSSRTLVGQFRGIALQMHNPGDENHPYEQFIDEIAATGANTVCLVIPGYQENGSAASIFIDQRKVPTRDRIRKIIRHAKSKGLRVIFMPIVLLMNPKDGEWRGKIKPDDWDEWWSQYTSFILRYAYLCNEEKVEAFQIGSELLSTETHTARWRTLIKKVRKVFDGLLSYSSNWDHYRKPEFWGDLDMIGMTAYYNLTDGDKPTLDRLKKAWKPLKKEILNWQATIGKPILFTELGWPNQDTCAEYPWNYYQSERPDPQAQANCFEAFFDAWIKEPKVAGFMVWEWRKSLGQDHSEKVDLSYVPYKKRAMNVISRYYRMPGGGKTATTKPAASTRPAATQPADGSAR
ncbi:MAG: hypothetical protein QGG42_15495 [Phycisphaerae bacterium]|jgi:hypothetical protein|nr:hypothetical protein [Phycisphaerae bacterium]